MRLTVVIPTYARGKVLLETIELVRGQIPRPAEILIVDQTSGHREQTEGSLSRLAADGLIRWIRLPHPSIPHAMNIGLQRARGEIVLFLDDDVIPGEGLIQGHLKAHDAGRRVVAGQVLQPGEESSADEGVGFRSSRATWTRGVMAGNLSVRRDLALRVGGFDENFVHVAYRFETEFADRLRKAGERIWFEPAASIRHLKASRGGTRTYGDHRRTLSPGHAVGGFYYILRSGPRRTRPLRVLGRLARSIRTRHHRARPWWIPGTLLAESMGLAWALGLALRGPRLLDGRKGDVPCCEKIA